MTIQKDHPVMKVQELQKAKELASKFQDIKEMPGWKELEGFINFKLLLLGRQALGDPDKARELGWYSLGVQFITAVLNNTIEDVAIVEDDQDLGDDALDAAYEAMFSPGMSSDNF